MPVPSTAPAAAPATIRFRALSFRWRPVAGTNRESALTLQLLESGMLDVAVCDGEQLLTTATPVACPWSSSGLPPATDMMQATLREHPYDHDSWQLKLTVGTSSAAMASSSSSSADASLEVNLVKRRDRDRLPAEAAGEAGGMGGSMLHALLSQIACLRAEAASRADAHTALVAAMKQRESELSAEAEAVHAEAVAELSCVAPLLLAKQEMLDALEREAVDKLPEGYRVDLSGEDDEEDEHAKDPGDEAHMEAQHCHRPAL